MTVAEILSQVQTIMRDVLDNDRLEITPQTTANDVAEWDSLAHIQLVVAIEKHFRIRFTAKELSGFVDVGDMCGGIQRRLVP